MSPAAAGMQVVLTAADVEAVLRWLVHRIEVLPGGTISRIDVSTDDQAMTVTLRDFDVEPLVRDASLAKRLIAKAIPRMDIPIALTGNRAGDRSLRVHWTITKAVLGLLQRAGVGALAMGRLATGLGGAMTDTASSAFTLHLDKLQAPVPAILQPWRLTSVMIPGPPGIAMALCAAPA